ncbi:chloride channel protein, CIC family [Pseudooceanicola antarcticus]|uniref:Chloride channel protein n=1 Tax=Pseudooceanicola antarcticus TaxID=1247613 RepID=A0A285J2T9_9RHOB|nr:chloride channel protein [Pseudooceanicola antarcticus]SNY54655.1 chloride channel protein, CIC family [Pseudooceanicola antarcticus]
MSPQPDAPPRGLSALAGGAVRALSAMRRKGPNQVLFWLIALGIGIAGGAAASAFRHGIALLQKLAYGAEDVYSLHSFAGGLPWYLVLLVPVVGGLIVGIILKYFTPDGRVRSVSDVIEGAALHEGRVEGRAGLASAAASLITLGTGGSSGREGPVVHLAAVLSSWVLKRMRADGITGRDLLGCAVAAAVSASFNAPIAGALFAMEVVLRHFALHAFAPITIAAVAGAVISRLQFGDGAEYLLPEGSILVFYEELPAFLLLGALCGVVAGAFMRGIFLSETLATRWQRRFAIPQVLRPMVAGGLLGGLAIWFPHIIGVGYETTLKALSGGLLLREAVIFAVLKATATAVTVGGRMGGGVFSPSMMMGALTGLAFGIVATSVFPEQSGSPQLYALAGMGGVAAAVLGAPISTTLIVFELTGDWTTALGVMVTVSISTAIGSRLVNRSFFLTQLERRGTRLAAGPQQYLLGMFRVREVMRPTEAETAAPEDRCWELIEQGLYLDASATLEDAFPDFERSLEPFLPVVALTDATRPPELLGALFHVDALRIYNRALAATASEEHG